MLGIGPPPTDFDIFFTFFNFVTIKDFKDVYMYIYFSFITFYRVIFFRVPKGTTGPTKIRLNRARRALAQGGTRRELAQGVYVTNGATLNCFNPLPLLQLPDEPQVCS